MLLGSLWAQVVVMELLNYGDGLVWGAWVVVLPCRCRHRLWVVCPEPGVCWGRQPRWQWGSWRREGGSRVSWDECHAKRSEGMAQGAGKMKAVTPVLLKSSNCRRPEIFLCVGDTVLTGQTQLRLAHPSFVWFCTHFQQQSSCTGCESKWALGCCASLWFILRKEHPDVSPQGKGLEPVNCTYSLWGSAASPTSAPWQKPVVAHDCTGVEIN